MAQKAPAKKPAKPVLPEPFAVNVFGDTWESGELRSCITYPNHLYLLVCDDDRFIKMVGTNMAAPMSAKDAFEEADTYATTHSKTFAVQFSKLPWALAPSDPNRKSEEPVFVEGDPNASDMGTRTTWKCSKDKVITCTFSFTAQKP
jgi:hypothetical protein